MLATSLWEMDVLPCDIGYRRLIVFTGLWKILPECNLIQYSRSLLTTLLGVFHSGVKCHSHLEKHKACFLSWKDRLACATKYLLWSHALRTWTADICRERLSFLYCTLGNWTTHWHTGPYRAFPRGSDEIIFQTCALLPEWQIGCCL